ncbi:uncharacterized protein [Oryza sativa Japonica Group]|uniref:Os07g0122900 protein n=2 Tax=Oryza sativa subsp. japonica TaxID=39947 RepID=A0A0P0X211_ORYSJ|nr:hypothetical protein EE612_036879 [Oryza sativa]USI00520.1 F-box domain-containing protein [Oryza sativa Japonica Group]BAF20708.1 Os07g0122900 [Oryza sativa Japonica Group]BAS99870.1 Os07g0122900 [Oryza sativa Japonica Group]|eukprot:NP_001058794.1 Os07g0122900 [Oryza sativa Japonica Group]
MAPPELTDDVVEEILLRLPPDDPSCSARASAVCKPWRRLLSDPVFLRRHRAFHRRRAPPLLGFIHHVSDEPARRVPSFAQFVPTTAFRPAELEHKNCWPLDCRHGRALFQSSNVELTIWDPMTGDVRRQREPYGTLCTFATAAVLCAVPGCDHHDCHGGPFVLVFVGNDEDDDGEEIASASSYSSETGTWTAASTVHHDDSLELESKPSVLAGDAVHFLTYFGKAILRYDLTKLELSVILPPVAYGDGDALLMTAEDGELGLALFDGEASIHLWARVAGAGWVRRNVIDLYAVLPFFDPVHSLSLVGFAEGTDIIFLHTIHGDYRMELKSLQISKLWEKDRCFNIFPYMSFFVPGTSFTNLLALGFGDRSVQSFRMEHASCSIHQS